MTESRADQIREALARVGANPGSGGIERTAGGWTLRLDDHHVAALLSALDRESGMYEELRESRAEEGRLRSLLSGQAHMWRSRVNGLQARLGAMVRIAGSEHANPAMCGGCGHRFWYFDERMPAACPACNRDPREETDR